MPFKPAKSEALRNFVVLDSEAVLSGLSALDGGAVDEILTKTTEDTTKQLGGQVGGRGAKAQAGRNKGRKVQEELRRRRTEHSAAAALIDRLEELEAVGEVEGAFDEDVAAALTPGDTIRVRGDVALHPLHQVDVVLHSFMEAASTFGEQESVKELRKFLPIWKAMVGSGKAARVLLDLMTSSPQVPRVILTVKSSALQDVASEVPGFCTILAKVDRIVGPDEHVLALRVLQNAPVSELERTTVEEVAVEMIDGFTQIGVPCTSEDLVMQGPIVMLRPICIWR
jgi:hypothetical protein